MVQAKPALRIARVVQALERQTPRLFQLQWGLWQYLQSDFVFLKSHEAADEILEPTQPTRQLQLGWVPTTDRTIRDHETTYIQTPQVL
jgi:hypothetical protein